MSSASATLMACPALPDRSIAAASAAALALFARCSTFEARLAKLDMLNMVPDYSRGSKQQGAAWS